MNMVSHLFEYITSLQPTIFLPSSHILSSSLPSLNQPFFPTKNICQQCPVRLQRWITSQLHTQPTIPSTYPTTNLPHPLNTIP